MYRSAYWNNARKCITLATWNSEGQRVRVDVPFKPYVYVESPRGDHLSIFGDKLVKKAFDNPFERRQFVDNFGGSHFYDNLDVAQQFLLDAYWQDCEKDDFQRHPLRVIHFDIETCELPNGEFPKPELAKAPINLITAYDTLDNKYHVFSTIEYHGNNLPENAEFNYCASEAQLLREFLMFWRGNDYPDIVAGWNSFGFDFPYTFNRIIKVLGQEEFNGLSPDNYVRVYETRNKQQQTVTIYEPAGVVLLDWMDVYAKFKVTKQESMKLDFIANAELGVGKVDYEGMTIFEFMRKQPDKFVEYNVQDVALLVKLERKLQYFNILRRVANLACANYNMALMTIPITNGAIAVRCRQRGVHLNTFKRKIDYSVKKPGGFVSSNAGFHESVVTIDASSLYPSLIRANNISPETKVGMCYFKTGTVFGTNPDDELTLVSRAGRQIELKRSDLHTFIKSKNLVLSANGCLFSQATEGLFPQFMRELYDQRAAVKKEIKSWVKKENALVEEQHKLRAELASLGSAA